jgi:hypothetical protein
MLNILKYVIFLWNSQFFLYLDQKRTAFYNYLNEDIKRVEIFENYFIVPTFLQECEEFMETLKFKDLSSKVAWFMDESLRSKLNQSNIFGFFRIFSYESNPWNESFEQDTDSRI